MKSMSEIEWIPVVIRPATDEEKEMYGDRCKTILDFRLPEYDMQEVLVTLDSGAVTTDYYDEDWQELECYDWADVRAWAKMPKGYGCEN